MSYLIKRAMEIFRTEGLIKLIKSSIRHVHSQLKYGKVRYNGVYVKSCPVFDPVLPWREVGKENYESGLVNGIRKHVKEGSVQIRE